MHVGAAQHLRGRVVLRRLRPVPPRRGPRASSASRLHLIPRFRKRIMHVPFEQGRPVWVDDDRFDISYHVRLTALPTPGSREQLLALTARIQAQLLDRTRPLWELWFVEGLEGGHVGLIQKTHHALVDGVSGVDVATVLLDFTPEPDVPRAAALDRRAATEPRPPARRHARTSATTEPAEIARTVRRLVRTPAADAASATGQLGRALARSSTATRSRRARRSTSPVGRRRRFEGVQGLARRREGDPRRASAAR